MEVLNRHNIEWNTESMCSADVTKLNSETICALLLGAVRAEKFCDGALLNFFKSGCIERWLTELKSQMEDKQVTSIKIDDLLDYKTKLQEMIQADKRKTVEYREVSKSGTANNPTYVFEVVLDGEMVLAQGTGKSKKEAQQDAAKKALEKCAA